MATKTTKSAYFIGGPLHGECRDVAMLSYTYSIYEEFNPYDGSGFQWFYHEIAYGIFVSSM